MTSNVSSSPVVVVTGANGLVGSAICAALRERGAAVRAVVRRSGAAPESAGVVEYAGDFTDPGFAATVVAEADVLITTVHPLGGDAEAQRSVGYDGTLVIAEAAAAAGVGLMAHLSTAAVYDRRPGVGDIDEHADLALDDASDYAVIKRDLDRGLAHLDGMTRVLLRPPAVLGPGESSVWNSRRPAQLQQEASARRVVPHQTFAWVHVDDLASLAAEVAVGAVPTSDDPERGPVAGGCTPVNVAGESATQRDYYDTVCRALGVEPVWDDEPVWTGQFLADRARRWGWQPTVDLDAGLAELDAGLRA